MNSNEEQAVIEKDFIQSWDSIEQFYVQLSQSWKWLNPIHNLIAELRAKGYDKHLRAGQAMDWFILSRSRKHGLREEQPRLVINIDSEVGFTAHYNEPDTNIELAFERVELTPSLEELIERLAKHPID